MIRLLTYPLNAAFIFGIALLMSLLNLSYIYEYPTESNILYTLLIISLYLICVFFAPKARKIDAIEVISNASLYKKFLLIAIFGFAVEFAIYGAPILSTKGRDGYGGIPVLHVVFYSSTMISVLLSSLYSNIKQVLLSLAVAILISIALLSRQMLMVCFAITIIASVIRFRITKYQYVKMLLAIICLVIFFGFLGNVRQQLSGDYFEDYIIEVGGANDAGVQIGDTLYWIWLYIASPIYNLFINFDSHNMYGESCNFQVAYGSCTGSFITDVVLPTTVSKYLGAHEFFIDMARPYLNAGTAFSVSARLYGIIGVSLQILLQLCFYLIGLAFTPRRVRSAFIVYFSVLSIFMVFDNLFIRGEFFVGFILIIISSIQFRLKLKAAD